MCDSLNAFWEVVFTGLTMLTLWDIFMVRDWISLMKRECLIDGLTRKLLSFLQQVRLSQVLLVRSVLTCGLGLQVLQMRLYEVFEGVLSGPLEAV